MKEWMIDENKPYLWHHKTLPIEVMCYTNDQDPIIRCIWMRIEHDGEYVSNYFAYSDEAIEMDPLNYALKMFDDFKSAKEMADQYKEKGQEGEDE